MTDNRSNHPLDPMEDQVLDRYLASLGRFSPGPGFGDRVMARVRVRAPVPARAPGIAQRLVRSRRWPVLAYSLSGAAAASSTALTAWVAANFQAMTAWASASLVAVAVPAWQAVLAWITTTSAAVGSALVTGALTVGLSPMIWSLAILTLAVPVSLIGFLLAVRPTHRMRPHVAR
ncbi:MAG: hypothetical protein HYW06_09040 [Gemmatimonadetes bacterium]|nr:hypothetical protein [Gemmatimonadota bacterium]MBI2402277.1 hypothetical protein [Gemmatimonadota bacterium]MBI2537084.1 hypothetical protein [Gemmatimonadota bacterium]MBI2615745.1 hypothetical protein [Gemmatimonadota bacterium]